MSKWEDWPKEVWPREVIFFSADLIGSTPLKQKMIQITDGIVIPDNSEWFEEIQYFYLRSFELFKQEFRKINDRADSEGYPALEEPRIWKTIGDEILFWAEVKDTRHVLLYIQCWKSAIQLLRKSFDTLSRELGKTITKREKKVGLDVKCCAWIAHFPWRNKIMFSSAIGSAGRDDNGAVDNNMELLVKYFSGSDEGGDLIPDFIGPGIDIGFRLAQQSSHRRFVISTDIAYMMAEAAFQEDRHLPNIHFEGLHILKGVFGGLEYPLFWVDMAIRGDIDVYGSDLQRRKACEAEDIRKFMNQFYQRRSNYMYAPFVVYPEEKWLKDGPDWYYHEHVAMLEGAQIKKLAA